jgi:endoglucanase
METGHRTLIRQQLARQKHSVHPAGTSRLFWKVCATLVAGTLLSFSCAGSSVASSAPAEGATRIPAVASASKPSTRATIVGEASIGDGSGYWTAYSNGTVTAHGTAVIHGDATDRHLSQPIVAIAATSSGHGYWLLTRNGGIRSFGDAKFYGSAATKNLSTPFVGISSAPGGRGYWVIGSNGVILSFGDAHVYGSTGAKSPRAPLVAVASTPGALGFWVVAKSGRVFSFGNAHSYGSPGGVVLKSPVMGIAGSSNGAASYLLKSPIVGMARTTNGAGYYLLSQDGQVYAFGDAHLYGSAVGKLTGAVTIIVSGDGYWVASANGQLVAEGTPGQTTTPVTTPTTKTPTTTTTSTTITTTSTTTPTSTSTTTLSSPPPPPPPTTTTTAPTTSTVGPTTTTSDPTSGGDTPSAAPVPRVMGNQLVDEAGQPLRLLGVDASGTEDACILDEGFSWEPTDPAEAAAIASWHTDAVRVPLNEDCWLGINGAPPQYSGGAYQDKIVQWVQAINDSGMVAILDLHWSAPGSIEAVQQWPMPDQDHSVTFWSQVAATFSSDPSVIFDLFNEPFVGGSQPSAADWSCWRDGCTVSFGTVSYQAAGMQELLDAVRAAGANQPVMVAGLNWAGDPCGIEDSGGNGGTCAWLAYEPTDPEHQLIASFHTYNWTACITLTCWDTSVLPVAASVPVVTGELGENDCSASFIDTYMQWADQHDISYLAWSWQPPDQNTDSCAGANMDLLSNWDGAPSTMAPAGPAFAAHLAALAAGTT